MKNNDHSLAMSLMGFLLLAACTDAGEKLSSESTEVEDTDPSTDTGTEEVNTDTGTDTSSNTQTEAEIDLQHADGYAAGMAGLSSQTSTAQDTCYMAPISKVCLLVIIRFPTSS